VALILFDFAGHPEVSLGRLKGRQSAEPFKLRPDSRLPDSLLGVLGVPSCYRRIFVVQATQLPKQEESLHVCQTVLRFRPALLKFFLGSEATLFDKIT